MSEALIFASTNPQYDDRLFIKLQAQYMKLPSSNLGRTCCVQKLFLTFRTIFVHNMFPHVLQKEELLTKIYLYIDSYLKFISWIYFIDCNFTSFYHIDQLKTKIQYIYNNLCSFNLMLFSNLSVYIFFKECALILLAHTKFKQNHITKTK